jgi:hypothetical protein
MKKFSFSDGKKAMCAIALFAFVRLVSSMKYNGFVYGLLRGLSD